MHTFKDAIGEEWAITLDTVLCRQILKSCGVNLLELDPQSMAVLIGDDATLVDVISLCCTDQILRRKLDERGFAQRLVGDALDDAVNALMGELVFICRPAEKRAVLQAAWKRATEATDRLYKHAEELINSEQTQRELDKVVQQLGT